MCTLLNGSSALKKKPWHPRVEVMFVSLRLIFLFPLSPEVYELGLEPGLHIIKTKHCLIFKIILSKKWMNKEKSEQQKRELGRCETTSSTFNFLLIIYFVAFKNSKFLSLDVQILVILLINSIS